MTNEPKGRRVRRAQAPTLPGFGAALNEDHAERIDRLVDDYEHRIVSHLNDEYTRATKWSDRFADRIAAFGGSWRFIIIFACFLFAWLLLNTVPFIAHFDGPPFILLNLILSFVAAFQAPIIMMSQNRQAARDKHEAIIDFAINYKAEQEVDDMQAHLHRMEEQMAQMQQMILSLTVLHSERHASTQRPTDGME